MKQSELEQITEKLQGLESDLRELEETSRNSSQPVQLDQASVGRLSRMDAMQSQQMALETARRRRDELARIEGNRWRSKRPGGAVMSSLELKALCAGSRLVSMVTALSAARKSTSVVC
jgi:hypothetical protein